MAPNVGQNGLRSGTTDSSILSDILLRMREKQGQHFAKMLEIPQEFAKKHGEINVVTIKRAHESASV